MKFNSMPTGAEGDLVNEQLRALGSTFKIESTEDRVFEALKKVTRGAKQAPGLVEIYRMLDLPETTVRSALRRLMHMGKAINPIKGVWVPVVVPRKNKGDKT
jgi:hypothetical protein